MASKMNKQFKERINEERTKKNEENKHISYEIKDSDFNSIVVFQLENKLIKVQSKRGVSRWDIQEQIEDLFSLGGCKEGEFLPLSNVCNANFDLQCTKYKSEDSKIEINMYVC